MCQKVIIFFCNSSCHYPKELPSSSFGAMLNSTDFSTVLEGLYALQFSYKVEFQVYNCYLRILLVTSKACNSI